MEPIELRRSLTLPLITLYGLGTMVGGGFYALVGKVAGLAGMHVPLAFLLAAVIAGVSAFSFAELSSRFPTSAGEAVYVRHAFRRRWLEILVGVAVIATGVVSAATLASAFAGFLSDLAPVPSWLSIVVLALVLGGIAAWGIGQSAAVTILITAIEVGALLLVLYWARAGFADLPSRLGEVAVPRDWGAVGGIIAGAFLCFYAFIGFEDMVNEAEEVQDPQRNLPIAILLALGITAVLYIAVSFAAVLALSGEVLAESNTPLAELSARAGRPAEVGMTIVSMLAGVNGALVQIVMASRVAYGLTRGRTRFRAIGHVHPRTRTPVNATAIATAVVIALALWFPLVVLAKATSAIMIAIFTLVNLSLLVIRLRRDERPEPGFTAPLALPIAGTVLCAAFLGYQLLSLLRVG